MHLLWRRWSRSGYAPSWFYYTMAAAFAALAAWAAVRGDWLVLAIAAAMLAVAVAGSRLMRRLAEAARASDEAHGQTEANDER